ncbi:hypothetical protein [Endozoicomonas sp. ISHI1]|uniref:hypothetical protein n=1 Tax=Endozoicomonas sp. ISHI1 TaxID=2825882 RepID=UPI0021486E8C|nr:hypothetical protein [Endozoicomonas sp. ISHI1]
MNLNTTKTETYGFHQSSLAEKSDGSFDSEQGVIKRFSGMRWVEDKSSALANQMPEPGFIVQGFSHQMVNQTITERKATHWLTTDRCEAVNVAGISETLTAEKAAEYFRNTIENLIHSLRYEKITRVPYDGDDQREEITGIFIDFILCQEGLVHDRCFSVESSPDKYVAGKTMSQERVEEIQSFVKAIFTEQAAKESKVYRPTISYSLEGMLVDYLNKKENVSDDVTQKFKSSSAHWNKSTFETLQKEIYPFFKTLLAGRGFFSELAVVFNFFLTFRQELVNSAIPQCKTNKLTVSLRVNRSNMREYFNRHVMDVIFSGRCDGIVNAMFDDSSYETENKAKPANRLKLKLGEELEYDVKNKFADTRGRLRRIISGGRLNDIFSCKIQEKGMSHRAITDERGARYGFDDRFTVVSFYDSSSWFEINCTPYHPDDECAKLSFEKVIEVTDWMREKGLVDYSSGHKHLDVLSATQGDTGVLLAIESEIQRNPFLLRAFGNNDRILEDNEASWYKTFADYNPDTKPFAVKRLNSIIDRYNKKIEENHAVKPSHKGSTDSEKKERLEQFAHFYSQLVHMTTIQRGLGYIDVDIMEKYMAMSLLHITGANRVNKLSTLEFRFFRCPKTVQEIELINQFLHAWFQYIHQCRKDMTPLQPVPENIQSCKEYTAEEVQAKTVDYLRKLGLNPEDYRCFWGEVRDIPSAAI